MLQLESEKADLEFRIDGEKLNIPIKLDYDKLLFYFMQFKNLDIEQPKDRDLLVDTFVNKVIVWNDKMIISYNVVSKDGEKVTKTQIIKDFEKKRAELCVFDSQQFGAIERT